MSHSVMCLVRPDPTQNRQNLRQDEARALRVARRSRTRCWILVVGEEQPQRRERLREQLGLRDVAGGGVNVFSPQELGGDLHGEKFPNELSKYLVNHGFHMGVRQSRRLTVELPDDLPPMVLAAVVEAVAVYPQADIQIGDHTLSSSLRWEIRRDKFKSPVPTSAGTRLIGQSPAVDKVRRKIALYAEQPYPVLIIGKTGTGKELVARMLHEQSGRTGRFMAQNAAQLPPELADSLLFGHLEGTFTGATRSRVGRIKETEGGSFFLDEVFNLHPAVQGKLLRALNRVEHGEILVEPVGSTKAPDVVSARLIVSALGDPRTGDRAHGTSSMRMDLFYRVSFGIIRLPELRHLPDDLPAFCEHLLGPLPPDVVVTEEGIDVLRGYSWPGNIRELKLILTRAVMDNPDCSELGAEQLRGALKTNRLPIGQRSVKLPCQLDEELVRIELATMRAALRMTGGNQSEAGRLIGMDSPRNFGRKMTALEAKLKKMEASDVE